MQICHNIFMAGFKKMLGWLMTALAMRTSSCLVKKERGGEDSAPKIRGNIRSDHGDRPWTRHPCHAGCPSGDDDASPWEDGDSPSRPWRGIPNTEDGGTGKRGSGRWWWSLAWVGSTFLFCGRGHLYKKTCITESSAMQVLPSRCNRMPSHRLTVCNHALAFGYSLATMIVYQKILSFERCRSDNSYTEPDNLTTGEGFGRALSKS